MHQSGPLVLQAVGCMPVVMRCMRSPRVVVMRRVQSSSMRGTGLSLTLSSAWHWVLLLRLPLVIKRLALDVRLSMRASRVEGDSVGTEDAALIHWVCQGASSKIGLIRWACGSGGRSLRVLSRVRAFADYRRVGSIGRREGLPPDNPAHDSPLCLKRGGLVGCDCVRATHSR